MLFSSVIFMFFFLPIVILLHAGFYFFGPKHNRTLPNLCLLCASLFFYAWGEPIHVLTMLGSAFFNFHLGLFIQSAYGKKSQLWWLWLAIIGNLAFLALFKYADFFLNIYHLYPVVALSQGVDWNFWRNIALPLGISFYTFQGMSYVIDVYRQEAQANRSFIDFACYLTMFPQLVAGPIVRYTKVAKELAERSLSFAMFSEGATRFIYGLAKKILIADTLGRVADAAFSVPAGELPIEAAWLGIICYTFQIYFDFSGYSDMAIGMGKMLGFHFPENFNYPYIARSIKDFWRRWHMTLSLWFRDYLYIPLGGSYCPKWRTALNLVIVFFFCGLWHGAAWGFVAWGLFHGFFLVIERIFPRLVGCLPSTLQRVYTMAVVMMAWVLFRTEHLDAAIAYYKALLGLNSPATFAVNSVWLAAYGYALPIALFFATVLATPMLPWFRAWLVERSASWSALRQALTACVQSIYVLALMLLCCLPLFGASYTAFIYFRF